MDRTIQVFVLITASYDVDVCNRNFPFQLEKKNTSEFTTIENTMEVQSLQMIGFLFSVCHTVLFVQVIHCIVVTVWNVFANA